MERQRAKTVFQKEEQEGGWPVIQERQQDLGSCCGRRAPVALLCPEHRCRAVGQNKGPEASVEHSVQQKMGTQRTSQIMRIIACPCGKNQVTYLSHHVQKDIWWIRNHLKMF